MRKLTAVTVLILFNSLLAGQPNPSISIMRSVELYRLSGQVFAFGADSKSHLSRVTVYLFSENRVSDSIRLDTAGGFAFEKLIPGQYDLAFCSDFYFPKKICQIQIDSTQKIYPSAELMNLEEKYPDTTWRPGRYLYVTFKSDLTENEVIRRLEIDYDLEILPFNNNSVLQPLLRYDGYKLHRATVLLPEKEEELKWANRLILDPYVHTLKPDVLLPFPPAIKTNQKPRVVNK